MRDVRKPYWEDEHRLDPWMCLENLTRETSRRLPNPRLPPLGVEGQRFASETLKLVGQIAQKSSASVDLGPLLVNEQNVLGIKTSRFAPKIPN